MLTLIVNSWCQSLVSRSAGPSRGSRGSPVPGQELFHSPSPPSPITRKYIQDFRRCVSKHPCFRGIALQFAFSSGEALPSLLLFLLGVLQGWSRAQKASLSYRSLSFSRFPALFNPTHKLRATNPSTLDSFSFFIWLGWYCLRGRVQMSKSTLMMADRKSVTGASTSSLGVLSYRLSELRTFCNLTLSPLPSCLLSPVTLVLSLRPPDSNGEWLCVADKGKMSWSRGCRLCKRAGGSWWCSSRDWWSCSRWRTGARTHLFIVAH